MRSEEEIKAAVLKTEVDSNIDPKDVVDQGEEEAKSILKSELLPPKKDLKKDIIEAKDRATMVAKNSITAIKEKMPSKESMIKYSGIKYIKELIKSVRENTKKQMDIVKFTEAQVNTQDHEIISYQCVICDTGHRFPQGAIACYDNHAKVRKSARKTALKEVAKKMVNRYGARAQSIKFIEESCELNKELCKVLNGKSITDDVRENIFAEIDDVIITLEELKIAVGYDESRIEDKLQEILDKHLS